MSNSRFQNFTLGRRALAAGVALAAGATMLLGSPTPAAAQWSTTYEQYYLPGASQTWMKKVEQATGRPLSADAFFRAFHR